MLQIGQYSVLTAVHWNDKNIPEKQIQSTSHELNMHSVELKPCF